MCRHMENALVHEVGDVAALRRHITDLHASPELLARLRAGALRSRAEWTWIEAGRVLLAAYGQAIRGYPRAQRNVLCPTELGEAIAHVGAHSRC
jgi:hypothetical protein